MKQVIGQPHVRTRVGKAAEIILPFLAAAGAVTLFAVMPGIAPGLKLALKIKRGLSESRMQKEFDLLEKNGYIQRMHHKSGDTYKLSSKGRFVLSTHPVFISERATGQEMPSLWDGVWRVIIFDVSEEDRTKRDLLRRTLHAYGFSYLQQSVWVYPYPCDDYIQLIKEHMGLRKNIVYMQARYIEGDMLLKKEFGLS